MATEKDVKTQKDFNAAQSTTIKNNSTLLNQTKSLTKLLADQTSKMSALGESQEDVISNFSDFSKQVKSFKGYTSEVIRLTQSFDSMNSEIEDVGKNLNQMGVESTKALSDLREEAMKTNTSFKKVISTMKENDKVKNSIDGIYNNLKRISDLQKGGYDDKATKSLKESFKSLQAYLNPDELSKYMEIADKLSTENFQESLEELNNLHLKDLHKNLKDLSSTDAFAKLGEESQKKVKEFLELKNFDKGSVDKKIQEVVDIMNEAHKKMSDDASNEINEITSKYAQLQKRATDYKESINKGMILNLNIQSAQKDFEDLKKRIAHGTAEGFVPENILANQDKINENQKNLLGLSSEILTVTTEIAEIEATGAKATEDKYENQRKLQKQLSDQLKVSEKLTDETERYLKIQKQVSDNPIGQDRADALSNKFFEASARLGKMGEKGGKFGKTMEFASKAAAKMGQNIQGAGIYLAVLSAAVTAMKKILSLQGDVAKKYASLRDIGVFSGGDVTKNLSDAVSKFQNLSGLKTAAMGGDAFALDFNEIKESVGALDQAGLKASKLNQIMKDIKTTSVANGNEFLKAADMVEIYSSNLGVSRGEVANLIGDMYINYNKSLKKIDDTLLSITDASMRSSVGSNRFLATVQTVTSGLSLYEDQVADTAQALLRMTEGYKLTHKQAEMAAKSANDFANNSDLARKNLAQLSNQDLSELKEQAKKEAAKLLGGRKESELEGADKSRYEAYKQFAEGDVTSMGATLKFLDQDLINKSFGMVLESLKSQATRGGKVDFMLLEELAKSRGLDVATVTEEARSGFKLSKALKSEPGKVEAKKEDLVVSALQVNREAGDANNKLIEALLEEMKNQLFKISDALLVITGIIAIVSGIATLVKLFGGASAVLGTISAAIGVVGSTLLAIGAGLGIGVLAGMAVNYIDEKYFGSAIGNAVQSGFDKVSRFFGGDGIVTDEEAFARAEKNFKKPNYGKKPEDVLKLKTNENKLEKNINKVPVATVPTKLDSTSRASTDAYSKNTGKTTTTPGPYSVVININGGDPEEVKRVVHDEIMKMTTLSKRT